jgi:hypothetical protein
VCDWQLLCLKDMVYVFLNSISLYHTRSLHRYFINAFESTEIARKCSVFPLHLTSAKSRIRISGNLLKEGMIKAELRC